jgi:hypothetical protein
MKRFRVGLVALALLAGLPAASWAYVVCTDVVTVYPNGVETHCRECNLYNANGDWTGMITTCTGDPQPGRGPV